uniref:Metalloendopeptidase n=1 Tax=Myripristis murdjan TaxID=586833 RepID=A0A667XYQ5_9TELE
DLDLHEGDILLMTVNRNIILESQNKWELPVPYILDKSLDLNAKGVILRAFEQIRLKTCVDFKPREEEPHYILVIKDDGCWSYVGNQHGGNQSLSIGQWCDHIAIVEHEFLHALGFWHEQSRYDRDDHVTIVWENIEEGKEHNFLKHTSSSTTTLGTPYDYLSVMHYDKDAFSNGNGSTIITNQPEYQDIIGQRQDMSANDILKLRMLYNCTSAVTFLDSCNFEDEKLCDMTFCAKGNATWEGVESTNTGPFSDHTNLGAHGGVSVGFFMHCNTAFGKVGDGAKMQSRRMNPKRQFQCLQFFYYHSGSDQDQLNIWIREHVKEGNCTNIKMIKESPSQSFWKLHHVPLNATKPFQVEFEVRKGAGISSGGFSIDDINLSETECPHHVWHITNFDKFLTNSTVGTTLLSPRFLTREGYGVQLLLYLYSDRFGIFFRLVSTDWDEQLQWPCARRQVTMLLLDQRHHIQQRMSRQFSITTNSERTFTGKVFLHWDNPRKVGRLVNDSSGGSYYAGPSFGYRYFLYFDAFWSGNFLKGGDVFFLLSFDGRWYNYYCPTSFISCYCDIIFSIIIIITTMLITNSDSALPSLSTGPVFSMLTVLLAVMAAALPSTL